MITKKLLHSPRFVPPKKEKAITALEKEIVRHPDDYSKTEIRAARIALKPEKVLKDAPAQRAYIHGAVEIATAAGVLKQRDDYHYRHHEDEVVTKTFRNVEASQAPAPKPTLSERRLAAGITTHDQPRPYEMPWRAKPVSPTAGSTTAPHAQALHRLGTMSNGVMRLGQVHLPNQDASRHDPAFDLDTPAPTPEPTPSTPTPPKTEQNIIEPTPLPPEIPSA